MTRVHTVRTTSQEDNHMAEQMSKDEIESQLTTILTEQFGVPEDEIEPDASFEAMGLDSLDLVEVTLVIDDEMGVRIPDDRLPEIETPRQAVDVIHELQGED